MKAIRTIFLIIVMMIPLFSHAEEYSEWEIIAVGDNFSWVLSLNKNISKTSSGDYRVWTKWTTAAEEGGTEVSKSLYSFSTDLTEFRILQILDYDASGNVVDSANGPSDIQYVVPGSIGEEIVNSVRLLLK